MARRRIPWLAVAALLWLPHAAGAQQLAVQELVLDNGMKVLMVPRKGDPNVAAGWVAKVGSVNERPGITGISHLFEHMMFKGTRTIGTTDIEKDLQLQAQMDAVKAKIRVEELDQARRLRLGEITDLRDPKTRTETHNALLGELAALEKAQKDLLVKNEFDRIYTSAGASGMNAGTSNDFTVYFINVPANKLELWFWMESDRLANPGFRAFSARRDLVRRTRNPADRRQVFVEMTDDGREIMSRLSAVHLEELHRVGPELTRALNAIVAETTQIAPDRRA